MIRRYGEVLPQIRKIRGNSMKNSGDPVPESAKKFKDDLSEAEVIAYLRARPDFLAHHPDVVSGMVAPERWSGDGVGNPNKLRSQVVHACNFWPAWSEATAAPRQPDEEDDCEEDSE